MGLHWLDSIVIAAYAGGLLVLGAVLSRRQTSADAYFLAGRRVPSVLAGISIVATLLSTVSYLAVPGEMIRYGVGLFSSQLAYLVVVPVLTRVVIPSLMRLPVTSVYEYLELRFGVGVRTLGAAVFIATRLIWIGLVIYTASFAVSAMTGWSVWAIAMGIGVVTTAYTASGGMQAVIWSDFAQSLVLGGGALFIPIYVGVVTGAGPAAWWSVFAEAGRSSVPVASLDPFVRVTIVGMILSSFVWNVCTHGADQVVAQRYLSTSSLAAARRSVWVFAAGNVALIGILMVAGVALFFLNYQGSGLSVPQFQAAIAPEADRVLPRFIVTELPPGLTGLLLAALLAAAMSSLSSGINSITAVGLTDLVNRFALTGPGGTRLTAAVSLSALTGALGTGAALAVNRFMQSGGWNLVELMERVNHLFVAPLGALFLAGLLSRRTPGGAVVIGFGAGLATSVLIAFSREIFGWETSISFMWIMPASFLVSLSVSYASGWLLGRSASATPAARPMPTKAMNKS